ncbi:unnamed protein product [Microthlaspi erraticum]|uniref:Uncharacterized protein n=1 Tax=Microthlaspi erraticum TaxID=1685480 RepID=A0A6D2I1N7_9BRAS|nr:unnamed protein product [Microthlaspi erraticum]
MRDMNRDRANGAQNIFKKLEEFCKDYPKLLLAFSVFVKGSYRPIPIPDDEDDEGLCKFQTTQTMVGKRVAPPPSPSPSPGVTMYDALTYLYSAEEAFSDEPVKYDQFLKIMVSAQSMGDSIALAKVEKLTRDGDHRNLLIGFSVFLSDENKMTFFPSKRNRTDDESHGAEDFTNKRKTRSQILRDAIAAAQADSVL